MGREFNLSRRTLLAGSVVTLVMTLPAGAFAQHHGSGLPVLVQISWGGTEVGAEKRSRTMAQLFGALEELGIGASQAWVLDHA